MKPKTRFGSRYYSPNKNGLKGFPSKSYFTGLASRPDNSPRLTRAHPAADENPPGSASLARQEHALRRHSPTPGRGQFKGCSFKGRLAMQTPYGIPIMSTVRRGPAGVLRRRDRVTTAQAGDPGAPASKAGSACALWTARGVADVGGMDNTQRRKQRPALADHTGKPCAPCRPLPLQESS